MTRFTLTSQSRVCDVIISVSDVTVKYRYNYGDITKEIIAMT